MTISSQTLYATYHIVFLAIFASTALLALGGILRIRPFDRISPAHVKVLLSVLVVELVAGVIGVYASLPPIETERTLKYAYQIQYENYLSEWLDSKPEGQRALCFGLSGTQPAAGAPVQKCSAIFKEYEEHSAVAGKSGNGVVYLTESGNVLTGIVSATLGDDGIIRMLQVDGTIIDETTRSLVFTQAKNCEHPGRIFSVKFTKDEANSQVGTITSEPDESGNTYVIATVVLSPIRPA